VVLVAAENPEALAMADAVPGVRDVEPDTDPARLRLHLDGDHRIADVITALVANGVRLTRAEPIEPTLEDLYFAVRTKKPIAEDGGRQLVPVGTADDAPMTDRHRQVAALTGWPGAEGDHR
jgi:type VI protein secretion system component VasA